MSDNSSINPPKQLMQQQLTSSTTTTSKPRLSLFSSKQSGIRLRSTDEQIGQSDFNNSRPQSNIDDQLILNGDTTLSSDENNKLMQDFKISKPTSNSMETKTNDPNPLVVNYQPKTQNNINSSSCCTSSSSYNNNSSNSSNAQQQSQTSSENESNRMNISKEDLIRLLSMLKSELQSKEIALAAIKCEQLKRLINPVEISRSSLANAYMELQDRFKHYDQNNNIGFKGDGNSSSASKETDQRKSLTLSPSNDNKSDELKQLDERKDVDKESLNILNTLLELLDRHPLLALPRDSIYCLDYNCNEVSTKNYLNLKIQHLDNLINQHRRYRYYMNERLKKSEQRYLDLTHQLELERLLKSEIENSSYKAGGKAILLKHIDQLKDALEKEKNDKQVIVMTLLNQLLDERENSNNLTTRLKELERNFEEEKSLKMEGEINELSKQLEAHSMVSANEIANLEKKVVDLQKENSDLKNKLEQESRSKTVPSRTNSVGGSPRAKDSESTNTNAPSSLRSNVTNSKQLGTQGKQLPSSATTGNISGAQSTNAHRASIGIAKSSPPPPPMKSATSGYNSTNLSTSSQARSGSGSSADGTIIRSSNLTSRNSPSNTSVANQRSAAPPMTSKPSVVGSTNTGSTISPSRINVANQAAVKPRVPTKPAQLMDQQRNSIN